jgi:hypothetical protein
MIPGIMIHTGMTTIRYTGHSGTHGDTILHGASAFPGVIRTTGVLHTITHHGIVLTGTAVIMAATGTRLITHTGTDTEADTTIPITEVITDITITITITIIAALFIMATAEAFQAEEVQLRGILSMQGM